MKTNNQLLAITHLSQLLDVITGFGQGKRIKLSLDSIL